MTRVTTLIGALAVTVMSGFATMGTDTSFVGAAYAQDTEVDTSTIVEMVVGDPDAPVEIIEYASFTCPHCAAFHEGAYQEIKKNYIDTGKVKLVYREVYFDRYGLWASMIARCAGPERFFGVTDMMYKTQSEWARAGDANAIIGELRKIGLLAGLDQDTLDACLQDGDKAKTLVAWYQENAEADEITGTPSFIVNGKKVSNMSYADFSALIDEELGS